MSLVGLEDAKLYCRVDGSDEDALIAGLIATAESLLDGWSGVLGEALITQGWEQAFDRFPDRGSCGGDTIRLPLGPLQAVDAVRYYDAAGTLRTFGDFHAVSDAIGPMLVLAEGAQWPATATRPDAVTVAWTCGYGDAADDVPGRYLIAAKAMVDDFYDGRSGGDAGPFSPRVRALLGLSSKVGF